MFEKKKKNVETFQNFSKMHLSYSFPLRHVPKADMVHPSGILWFWCNGLIGLITGLILLLQYQIHWFRSSPPAVFLGKDALKVCNKFTGQHPCRSVVSLKLQSNCIEITLRHECSPVNLLHIFRAPFTKNTSGRLLLLVLF